MHTTAEREEARDATSSSISGETGISAWKEGIARKPTPEEENVAVRSEEGETKE